MYSIFQCLIWKENYGYRFMHVIGNGRLFYGYLFIGFEYACHRPVHNMRIILVFHSVFFVSWIRSRLCLPILQHTTRWNRLWIIFEFSGLLYRCFQYMDFTPQKKMYRKYCRSLLPDTTANAIIDNLFLYAKRHPEVCHYHDKYQFYNHT